MCEAADKVKILRLGAEGDGLAAPARGAAGKSVYVPFTLPGETVKIALPRESGGKSERRARLIALETRSPERQKPLCRSFGLCGGCALQHWQAAPYQAWKRQRVLEVFAREGISLSPAQLSPLFPSAAGARRRLALTAKTGQGKAELGFNQALSHEIVGIEECPVAAPQLVAALPVLRACLAELKPRSTAFRLTATAAVNGLDIALQGASPALSEAEKLRLSAFLAKNAANAKILRLTSDGEIIISRAEPVVRFGKAEAELPAGGFLQASAAAEAHMAALAQAELKKCKNIADLFAGCGSFTFRLAEKMNVHAVEWDKAALASLERAGRAAAQSGLGLKTITAERRDLFQQPLTAGELAAYDGLVFDPPRAGAERQAREIAKSAVRRVVAVSCNPATLARDVRILLSGGYELGKITPIDQFLWSPHIEAVAALSKRPAKKSWTL